MLTRMPPLKSRVVRTQPTARHAPNFRKLKPERNSPVSARQSMDDLQRATRTYLPVYPHLPFVSVQRAVCSEDRYTKTDRRGIIRTSPRRMPSVSRGASETTNFARFHRSLRALGFPLAIKRSALRPPGRNKEFQDSKQIEAHFQDEEWPVPWQSVGEKRGGRKEVSRQIETTNRYKREDDGGAL